MAAKLQQVASNRPIVDNLGWATQEIRSWFQSITERSLIIGSGTPEDVVESPQGAEYMDEDGVAGSFLFKKQKSDIGGDKKKGWLVIG